MKFKGLFAGEWHGRPQPHGTQSKFREIVRASTVATSVVAAVPEVPESFLPGPFVLPFSGPAAVKFLNHKKTTHAQGQQHNETHNSQNQSRLLPEDFAGGCACGRGTPDLGPFCGNSDNRGWCCRKARRRQCRPLSPAQQALVEPCSRRGHEAWSKANLSQNCRCVHISVECPSLKRRSVRLRFNGARYVRDGAIKTDSIAEFTAARK